MRRAATLAAALLTALVLALPTAAAAATDTASAPIGTDRGAMSPGPPAAPAPAREKAANARAAERIAAGVPRIAAERRRNPGSYLSAQRKDGRWVVDVWTRASRGSPARQIGQVYVDPPTGIVTEAWTGPQVAWTMARGYPGAFGRSVNAPWIWITLCVLFVLPFVDVRRPLRWLHLDLLALVGFSASLAFFNDANLDASVPLAYPLLAYLLARLVWIGLRRRPRPAEPLRLLVPWRWLAVATLFLLGFRIGLNALDGNVIDVGYSGVIGADKLVHGRALYGAFPTDNGHGDTYGPLLYLAYVPFELIWPWQGRWDDLPAAHAAAGAFDVACVVLLFLIGRRLRGPVLGVALAWAWVAFPFTTYATNSGTNDALPAALVLAAIWLHARPAARGAFAMAAGLTKFAPLALLPLFASHGWRARPPGTRVRGLLVFCAGAAAVAALGAALVLSSTDPATFWERTIAYQAGRDAPFSVWGLYGGGWETGQRIVQAAALAFAVAVAFLPRRDDVVGLAALAGALLVAMQLATTYWFYLYLIWMAPMALIAFLGRLPAAQADAVTAPAGAAAPAPARSHPPAAAPTPG